MTDGVRHHRLQLKVEPSAAARIEFLDQTGLRITRANTRRMKGSEGVKEMRNIAHDMFGSNPTYTTAIQQNKGRHKEIRHRRIFLVDF
jgi:hypothetical protein